MAENKRSRQPRRVRMFLIRLFDGMKRLQTKITSKTSSLLGSLSLVLLTPDEHQEFIRHFYCQPRFLKIWGKDIALKGGLSREESQSIARYLKGGERCLVLASGGGREALALAELGFEVTGIDISEKFIAMARENARALSLNCTFEVKDFLDLPESPQRYDMLLLSQSMYSAIPTRRQRVRFLKSVGRLLTEDGLFCFSFFSEDDSHRGRWKFKVKRRLARMCGGYQELEEGDRFVMGDHYWHFFTRAEFLDEIRGGGFRVVEVQDYNNYAVLTPLSSETSRQNTKPDESMIGSHPS